MTQPQNPFKPEVSDEVEVKTEVISGGVDGGALPVENAVAQAPVAQAPVAQTSVAPVVPVVQAPAVVTQIQTNPVISDQVGIVDATLATEFKLSNLEKFPKMAENERARVSFVLFDQSGNPRIKQSTIFFDEDKLKMFIAPKDPDLLQHCIARFQEPKIRFSTVLFKYRTDPYGNIPQRMEDVFGELYAFTFSTDKFPVLKALHNEWDLSQRDIMFMCSDTQYQKMTITPTKDSPLWRQKPELVAMVEEKAQIAYDKYLDRFMGKMIPDNEIKIALGLISPPNPVASSIDPFAVAPPANVSGIAGQVGGGQAQGGDFSNLVQNSNS